jgi:uncharacterized membrane protein YciS (DUF1049 family)
MNIPVIFAHGLILGVLLASFFFIVGGMNKNNRG